MPYNILGDLQLLTLADNVTCANPCCILTINDTVQLMADAVLTGYASGSPVATLPESMSPLAGTTVPVCLTEADGVSVVPLSISTGGVLSLTRDVESGTVHLNGLEFNCCDRYYNDEIGNNFPQGTSPLRWNEEEEGGGE